MILEKQLEAYKVLNEDLPIATKKMNCVSDNLFKSKVIDIIIGECVSIVIAEIYGSYPWIENQWDEFIIHQ